MSTQKLHHRNEATYCCLIITTFELLVQYFLLMSIAISLSEVCGVLMFYVKKEKSANFA